MPDADALPIAINASPRLNRPARAIAGTALGALICVSRDVISRAVMARCLGRHYATGYRLVAAALDRGRRGRVFSKINETIACRRSMPQMPSALLPPQA